MESVTRKSLLNKSALGFYCINHVQGCSHGCRYPCYAFSMARSYGRAKDYADWCRPRLVSNACELLEKELGRFERPPSKRGAVREKPPFINLCLTTDPFMYRQDEVVELSLKLIALINSRGIPVSVLTKGILPAELADRGRFPAENVYGMSLVSLSEGFREKWEPGAAPYAERLAALRTLHEAGRKTLVHMEPYPTPNIIEQDLGVVLGSVAFVDGLWFGGWNYSPLPRQFGPREEFYRERAAQVLGFCEERGIEYQGG
jgi:DNA repair photolyase